MGLDMFLLLEGVEKDPLVLAILAWSHGFSSPNTAETIKDVAKGPHPKTWDTKAVSAWLESVNLKDLVPKFLENEITGKELQSISTENLKEMGITKIGHRIRFLNEVASLFDKYSKVNMQDLSFTVWMDDRTHKAMYFAVHGAVIPQATLIIYKGGDRGYGRNQGNGSDDDDLQGLVTAEERDPMQAVRMKNCIVTSFSTGGSGGEDRLTANLTMNASSFTFMGLQHPMEEAKQYSNYSLNPHGVIIQYEATGDSRPTTGLKEWGRMATWSKSTHFSFPKEFRTIVKTMSTLYQSKRNRSVSSLPQDCLYKIFLHLSRSYIPTNPMEELPFPGRIPKKKAEEVNREKKDED